MERTARIVQIVVAVGFGALLALKVRSQRRLGERSIVLDPRPRVAVGEVLAIGGLFAWVALLAVHGLGAAHRSFGPVLLDLPVARGVGILLALGGLAWTGRAWSDMGAAWRIGVDRAAPPRLVERGLFARSRNPIYVGIDVLALAAFGMTGTLFHALSALLILAGVHARIRHEEYWMASVHGAEWERYRARVPRYL